MKQNNNSFDAVANYYDWLASLVFGPSIRLSQRCFLNDIVNAKEVLIIGGGTGWILKHVLHHNAAGTITFVDASRRMLEKAEWSLRGNAGSDRVIFVHGTENILADAPKFDAVIANFFFDMFGPAELDGVIARIRKSMTVTGMLIATDFTVPKTIWHKLLLQVMYSFFGLVSRLQAKTLPPWEKRLAALGFLLRDSADFYDGFIKASKYTLTHFSVQEH